LPHEPVSPTSRLRPRRRHLPRRGAAALVMVVATTGLLAWTAGEAAAAPLAFPGAEGFAAAVAGGRKGQVVHVTTLGDSGAGSLRDAVSGSNRIVVFDVSGVIKLGSVLVIGGDNITLAGQSAPGDGITIYGRETSFSSRSNIVVRYLRFRQGMIDTSGSAQKTVNITDGQSMIFDHVSIQWGRWDNFGITGTSTTVTLQNSIVGEGVPPQNFGSIIDGEQDITIAHNLWIDNNERNPKFKANGECINNVVYDWGSGGGIIGGHSGADWYEDYVGNYLIAGPSAVANFFTFYTSTDHAYQTGNMVDVNRDGQLNGRAVVNADFAGTTPTTFEAAAHSKPPVPVTVLSAEDAYARVMAQAGTCQHRDAVEARLVAQLGSLGTKGAIIADEADVGGQPAMAQVTRPAGFDTDGDGMPDAWEIAHGLDPNSASDGAGDSDGDGYTNVEEYLNELADLACPGSSTTMPPGVADAGAPVDAAVSPVDARDATGSGGGGKTGTGGAVASGGVTGAGAGGSGMAAATGGEPGGLGGLGSGGSPGTGGQPGSGEGASPGAVGAGGRIGTGEAPGNGAAQAGSGGCSCRMSPVATRNDLALLGMVMLALRVRKRHGKSHRKRHRKTDRIENDRDDRGASTRRG